MAETTELEREKDRILTAQATESLGAKKAVEERERVRREADQAWEANMREALSAQTEHKVSLERVGREIAAEKGREAGAMRGFSAPSKPEPWTPPPCMVTAQAIGLCSSGRRTSDTCCQCSFFDAPEGDGRVVYQ